MLSAKMKYVADEKDDFYCTIFTELKNIGVKVPKVKKFKSTISKQEKVLPDAKRKIFGVSLSDQEWVTESECLLPKFIACSISYLHQYLNEVGLFRKAGSVARQRELKVRIENGEGLSGSEPNDIACLLKLWLRELPEPLIPIYMHDLFFRCHQLTEDENRLTAILLTCLLLPPDHLYTLKYLLSFLAKFAEHCDRNKMGVHNLALIMAPNIFVLSTDSADKTNHSLYQMHTSVVELLIEHAEKIGDVPSSISFHAHSHQEGRGCTDLDSSGDFLDVMSPVKSRKKRSGTVADFLTNIKKLVGQNSTPGNGLKSVTPEKFWNSRTAVTEASSAVKRKADPDLQSVSKNRKTNVSDDADLPATPKNKGNLPASKSKSGGGHSRKKSFGLLRRKERKRQKSAVPSSQEKRVSFGSPVNWSTDASSSAKISVEVMEPEIKTRTASTGSSGKKLLKSDSIKKSTSDCLLTLSRRKSTKMSLPSSSSQGSLQNKALNYGLRSGSNMMASEPSALSTESKEVSKKKSNPHSKAYLRYSTTSETTPTSESNPTKSGIDKSLNSPLSTESPCTTVLVPKTSTRHSSGKKKEKTMKTSEKSPASEIKSKDPSEIPTCSLLSESLMRINNNMIQRQDSNRVSYKGAITRQEAFIVRSKQKSIDALDQIDSLNVVTETWNRKKQTNQPKEGTADPNASAEKLQRKKQSNQSRAKKSGVKKSSNQSGNTDIISARKETAGKVEPTEMVKDGVTGENMDKPKKTDKVSENSHRLRKSKSVNLQCKSEAKERTLSVRVDRRTSRKGSLIRGRPNTVKSGLPSDLCQKFNNDSMLSLANESKLAMDVDDNSTEKSIILLNNEEIEKPIETSIIGDKDTSLDLKFSNIHLFSPPATKDSNSAPGHNVAFSTPKQDVCVGQNLEISLPKLEDMDRKLSLSFNRDRRSGSSDSKIPKLRSSIEKVRGSPVSESTPERKRKTPKSRASTEAGFTKIPVIVKTSPLSTVDTDMSDSCFKTPNSNVFNTPSSITWMSGTKYLAAMTSPQQEEVFNKRESIAMILKSKHGHVQAKVSMYDTQVRDSVYCTRSVPTFSTPISAFGFNDTPAKDKSSQKSHKAVTNVRSYDSISDSLNRKDRCKFPLPPPPKFSVADMDDTSSPAVRSPLKEVKNISYKMSSSQSSEYGSPMKDSVSDEKWVKGIKPKRNSFSGKTPRKVSKRVSRSESSPGVRRMSRVSRLKQDSVSSGSSVSSENAVFLNPRMSASKISDSCLSLEKLRSDQMIDEWQCEM